MVTRNENGTFKERVIRFAQMVAGPIIVASVIGTVGIGYNIWDSVDDIRHELMSFMAECARHHAVYNERFLDLDEIKENRDEIRRLDRELSRLKGLLEK